jgi:hypothetical protein
MYKIQLDGLDIQDGTSLKTDAILRDYDIRWNSTPDEYYTLSIVDEGDVTPTVHDHKERLHLLLINISKEDSERVLEFLPIFPKTFQKPHRFRIDLFWQSGPIAFPPKELLQFFDLPSFLEFYRQNHTTLLLEDTVRFQVQRPTLQYAPSPPRRKQMYPTFNARYNLDTLTEDDIRLIGDTYCISKKKSIPEILKRIERTLNYAS